MADLSGLMSAVGMGMDRRQKEKDARQEGLQYIGEKIYRSKKDADDLSFKKTEMNEDARQFQIEQEGLNKRQAEINRITEGNQNLQVLMQMYGEVEANRRAAMAGRITPEDKNDLDTIFDKAMGYAELAASDAAWKNSRGTEYERVFYDPEKREQFTEAFKNNLEGRNLSDGEKAILMTRLEDFLRDAVPVTPEPVVTPPALTVKSDPLARAFEETGAVGAVDFWDKTGVKPTAADASSYLTRDQETSAPVTISQDVGNELFGNKPLQMPTFARSRGGTRDRGSAQNSSEVEWGNLVNEVKGLLNNIYPQASAEDKARIKATVAPVINEDATTAELRSLITLLNRIGGR